MHNNLSLRFVYIGLDTCYIFSNYISQVHNRESPWIMADGTSRFNVPPTTVLRSRHHLQEIGTTWNHPCSGQPPGSTSAQDWHIRLKHLWDQWRPSTRTVTERPARHNARMSTQNMRNRLRRFTRHARRPYRSPNLNSQRRAAILHWVKDSLCWHASNWEQDFSPMSSCFVSSMVMDGSRCEIARASVMPTPAVTEQDQRDSGSVMVWSVIHSHDRNGLVVLMLNSTLNLDSYMDKAIQPQVVPYVQGDKLKFQLDNTFAFSSCLTQHFPRSNSVRTLPWPPHLPSCAPWSIGAGSSDMVTWTNSANHGVVMPGNPECLGWHSTGKNYSTDPIHATEMQSSAWGTWFVTIAIDLTALNGRLHRAKCHNKLLFSKWWFTTDCWFNPHQTDFFGQFSHLLNFPLKLMCVSFFCSVCIHMYCMRGKPVYMRILLSKCMCMEYDSTKC